jgi:DNA-binding GntR family transcriptional regulator
MSSVRQTIENDIVEGRLPLGSRLDEGSLAQRFQVSRTPIREALLQLSAIGLIELRPRRGAIVKIPSIKEALDMFETMAELEAACGRYAARRISSDAARQILEAHEACSEAVTAGDRDLYYEANAAFHGAIYRASCNGFLANEATSLHRRLAPLRRFQLRARNRMAQSFAEHAEIVSTILKGDEAKASELLREHVLIQGERFSDVVTGMSEINTG